MEKTKNVENKVKENVKQNEVVTSTEEKKENIFVRGYNKTKEFVISNKKEIGFFSLGCLLGILGVEAVEHLGSDDDDECDFIEAEYTVISDVPSTDENDSETETEETTEEA